MYIVPLDQYKVYAYALAGHPPLLTTSTGNYEKAKITSMQFMKTGQKMLHGTVK